MFYELLMNYHKEGYILTFSEVTVIVNETLRIKPFNYKLIIIRCKSVCCLWHVRPNA